MDWVLSREGEGRGIELKEERGGNRVTGRVVVKDRVNRKGEERQSKRGRERGEQLKKERGGDRRKRRERGYIGTKTSVYLFLVVSQLHT